MAAESPPSELDDLLDEDKNTKHGRGYLDTLKGIALAFAWMPLGVTSGSCVQLLEHSIPDFELNFFRFGIAWIFFTLGVVFKEQRLPRVPRDEIGWTFLFAIGSFGTACLYFIAVTMIPLADATSIEMTITVTVGIILLAIFVGEKITCLKTISSLICVLGVFCAVQPGFIFSGSLKQFADWTSFSSLVVEMKNGTTARHGGSPTEDIVTGYVLVVTSGISTALNIVLIKKRPYLRENIVVVFFWVCLLCTISSLVVMAISERPTLPSNWSQFFYIVVHCLTYVMYWPVQLLAGKYISGTTITLCKFTTPVFMLVPQYTVLSSILPGHRNWVEVVGVVLVLVGCAMNSAWELLSSKTQEKL